MKWVGGRITWCGQDAYHWQNATGSNNMNVTLWARQSNSCSIDVKLSMQWEAAVAGMWLAQRCHSCFCSCHLHSWQVSRMRLVTASATSLTSHPHCVGLQRLAPWPLAAFVVLQLICASAYMKAFQNSNSRFC